METNLVSREEYVAVKQAGEWAEVGGELKEEREALGVTIAEASRNIGVSPSTLSRFEKGNPVRSARVIENGYRMYLRLVEQEVAEEWRATRKEVASLDDVDSEEAYYGVALNEGTIEVYCPESGHVYFSIPGYDRVKDAAHQALNIAEKMGYTPYLISSEVDAILSTPRFGDSTMLRAFGTEPGKMSIYALGKSGRVEFDTIDELFKFAMKELKGGTSVNTEKAIAESLGNSTYRITSWADGQTIRTNSLVCAMEELGFVFKTIDSDDEYEELNDAV
ncbi:helix-turn-helix transcriptional regulator [Paenibacillus sp. S-12]|uniref:helix-turn-helix domain-containing protein n=1 Tax=Paenibacillus sp. S-12 TaxID=3031371 RepID=UPI0025A12550|nr:helix-turn-helix transcriptional regulator [Paenibacillus sp. S-12]